MRKSVCIMCGEEKDGLEVKEDRILGAMRWVKSHISKNPKNYRLVVCKEDYLKYKKKYERYERNQMLYLVLGIIFLFALGISTRGNLGAIGFGILITIFLFLLAQLSYLPALKMPPVEKKR